MKVVFDVGGTNMRVARVEGGNLGDVKTVPSPATADEGLSVLASMMREEGAVEEIVGGIAGVMEDGVLFRSPNLLGWEGARIVETLSSITQNVRIENDAALACLGEAQEGAGKGFRIVAYLGIGTGVGGGRCVEGRLEAGAYNAEPGHQIIREGKTLESFVSGGALKREYGVRLRELPKEDYERCERVLAEGIVNTILLWSPDVLVLGGALMDENEGYDLERLTAQVASLQHMYPKLPEIRRSALKDAAGLWGAVHLHHL